VSTSDGGLPVHRHERDYLSGPNVSTAIFLCLTLTIQRVSPWICTIESENNLLFWKYLQPNPAGIDMVFLAELMAFRVSDRLAQSGRPAWLDP